MRMGRNELKPLHSLPDLDGTVNACGGDACAVGGPRGGCDVAGMTTLGEG